MVPREVVPVKTEEVIVSVCVITYNHEKFISQCLDSILSQKTNFKFNVFVSDDCSKDTTLDILLDYQKRFSNVNVQSRCNMEKSYANGRATGNRNLIENIARSNGKYIALCDGDDFWACENKLQKQVDILQENKDVAIVCSSMNKVIDDNVVFRKFKIPDITFSSNWLSFYNPIPSSSAMFRRESFQIPNCWYFTESEAGDWPLWFMVARNKKIIKLSSPLLNYRVHENNFWMNKLKSERSYSAFKIVRLLAKEYNDLLLSISSFLHFSRYSFHKLIERIKRYA